MIRKICLFGLLLYVTGAVATTFRSRCPPLHNPLTNCTVSNSNKLELECSSDETCKSRGQVCCHNGCSNVCTDPLYYKVLCPENDILTSNDEWIKFCLGNCNCPDGMTCCPGPCKTRVCRRSNNKRADCPSPNTYDCISKNPLLNHCTSHKDCITNDQLCCPDACDNRYCQDPEYHDDETGSFPQIAPQIDEINSKTENISLSCDPSSSCFDISSTLGGESLESFFPLWTVFIHNTAEKCAALCQLWGYASVAISTEVGCFCFSDPLDNLICKSEELCSFKCPGGGNRHCGGILPIFVSIYSTDIISLPDAVASFPSGMCYKPKTEKSGDLIADVVPKIPNLTPNLCKQECGHRGFAFSCTYLGKICGCYSAGNQPTELSPFQEYCNSPCNGDANGVPNGITCGGQPSPALPVVNCLSTF